MECLTQTATLMAPRDGSIAGIEITTRSLNEVIDLQRSLIVTPIVRSLNLRNYTTDPNLPLHLH